MFTNGFNKIAATMKSNISPEEYYELKGEKDPWVGATLGAITGAAAGGIKGKSHKSALMGAGLGGAAGASTGYLVGKGNKALRLSLLKKEIKNLKLKSSPSRGDYDHGGQV